MVVTFEVTVADVEAVLNARGADVDQYDAYMRLDTPLIEEAALVFDQPMLQRQAALDEIENQLTDLGILAGPKRYNSPVAVDDDDPPQKEEPDDDDLDELDDDEDDFDDEDLDEDDFDDDEDFEDDDFEDDEDDEDDEDNEDDEDEDDEEFDDEEDD